MANTKHPLDILASRMVEDVVKASLDVLLSRRMSKEDVLGDIERFRSIVVKAVTAELKDLVENQDLAEATHLVPMAYSVAVTSAAAKVVAEF